MSLWIVALALGLMAVLSANWWLIRLVALAVEGS